MAIGNKVTQAGLKLMFNRAFKSTPDYSVPSLFGVGTGNNTPAITDTQLQTQVELTTGVSFAAFSAGYPTIDDVNLQLTIRAFLSTLQANGNTLREMGIFNSDTSKLMFSRAVFDDVEKTNSVQVSFINKFQMVPQ